MAMKAAVPLYGYQKRWLQDKSRFKLGRWSRQTGKTFTTTLDIVDDCFEHIARGRRTKWVILSRGERQSREAMEAVKMHCRAYNLAIEELEGSFKGSDDTEYKMLEVVLPGGTRIIGLPANADTARGFSANVFLDEFAFHADSRAIWAALFPVISNGFRLIVTSTPNGKGNKFYELATTAKGWSRHVVTIHEAVADGLPRNIDELREGLSDEDLWKQEYECDFIDEAHAWLPYELINAVEHELAGKPELYTGGPAYLGIDIAARKDLFVATAFEEVGDVLWEREMIVRKGIKFAEQDQLLDQMVRRYRVVRLDMDQTGMGEKPVEDAKRRYGETRVQGILFTNGNKQLLATQAKQRFEDRRIRLHEGDRLLRGDLHSIQRSQTDGGTIRFTADRESGSHADRAWSIFLGINAASTPYQTYAYEAVRPVGGKTTNPMRPSHDDDVRRIGNGGGWRGRSGAP